MFPTPTNPRIQPSTEEVSWLVPSISLEDVEGNPPIDLCCMFCFDGDYAKTAAKMETTKIILPPSIYEPDPDKKDVTLDLIIDKAMKHSDTTLIKGKIDKTVGNEIHYYLLCECKRKYYSQRGATTSAKENQKENFRQDRIVDKGKGSRGPDGRSFPRRTETSKPHKKCPVEFKLRLIPGQYWYFKRTRKALGIHNHSRTPFVDKHRRMKTYSQEELNLAQTYSQICPAGAAMALTSKATGTLAPSKDQLRYNKSPTSNKPVSQSQALIEYLREQVSLKKMRFVALYHEVTETSLLIISKASMNRRAQQMNNEGVFDEDLEQAEDIQLTYEDSSSTVQQLRLKSAAEKVGIAEALLA
ncbi:hypothetical protein SEMRO_1517_G279190.1 [Seminavis robusta]|nr:hypothetical protein SEMRO_1517_G279190.1 [Seminavis robusta]|eukprot:Sro1517_g279190.1 n/a (357) ;mRNA; f:26375-27445